MTDAADAERRPQGKRSPEEVERLKAEGRLKKRRNMYENARAMTDLLLNELGAVRLIVVDDEALSPDLYLSAYQAAPDALDGLGVETDWREEPDAWAAEVRAIWAGLPIEQKRAHRDAAREVVDELPEYNAAALETLESMFAHGRLLLITPENWLEQREALLAEGPAIVLFDQELGDFGRSGLALLDEYLAAARAAGLELPPAGILSQKVTEQGELTSAAESRVPPGELVLIAKEHLANGELARAVQLFRLTANLSRLMAARERILGGLRQDLETALEQAREISPRVLEDLVYRSSRREGAWEGETFARLVGLLVMDAARERELGDAELRDVVAAARSLTRFIDDAEPNSSKEAKRFHAIENYVPRAWVNTLQLPLVNGDLFEWSDGGDVKLGVMVCQPCDLVLRPDGTREAPDARLLRIEKKGKQASEKLLEHPLATAASSPLPEYGVVHLKGGFTIDLAVLDLCWMNADGDVSIDDVDAGLDHVPLTDGMAQRRGQLRDQARQTLDFIGSLDEEQRETAVGFQRRGELQLLYDYGRPRRWAYPIKRIGRLTERHAEAILVRYAASQARAAFEHDLSQFGEPFKLEEAE